MRNIRLLLRIQKVLPIFLISIALVSCTSSEQITSLQKRVDTIESLLVKYETMIEQLKAENETLKAQLNSPQSQSNQIVIPDPSYFNQPSPSDMLKQSVKSEVQNSQCKATTAKGTQCSRTAQAGSDYCWQHQKTKSEVSNSPTSSGKTIYTGPRGGKYYINSKGNKTYVRKK